MPPDHVLMGIPFYGYDFSKPDEQDSSSGKKRKASSSSRPFSANPIMSEAFLSVLRNIKPKLKWEEKHVEHRIKYKVGSGGGVFSSVAVVAGLPPAAWSASC